MGPVIVTEDEFKPDDVRVYCTVDGEKRVRLRNRLPLKTVERQCHRLDQLDNQELS